jgi:hypothetical protein
MGDAPDFAIVPVEALTRPKHRFVCVPYHATMTGAACVGRQDTAAEQIQQDHSQQVKDRLLGDYEKCLRCPVGERIRLQLLRAGAPNG